ncbi:IS6 family transposase [Halococcus dombrowskii]|uniref:IS6 family transposase n=1 Tax=Halococcus dombrowskii TaxID=179637 RepID=A0AAX3AQ77_HALDO|nr:IS6 family transposase [Halococcus dombrowskii]UOO95165.1 IS6 family transposase [Halococcus dombrowskii]
MIYGKTYGKSPHYLQNLPGSLRALAVRLHSAGISYRETAAALESIGIKRSHQVVYQWTHRVGEEAPDPPRSAPRRVAIDETAIRIGRGQFWVYAALDDDSKLLLGVRVSRWRGTRPASSFLSELKGRHDLSETKLLVDGMGYLTALAQTDLGGHLDYVTRNLIEKWFQTLKMRVDRFHHTWMGGRASAQRWLAAFTFYYNYQRPNQALDNRTPIEEVTNSD